MAHFCELDENNVVLRTVVINNNDCLDENNVESEAVGIAFAKKLFGKHTKWIQTSYNKNFRKRFGQPGDRYDSTLDGFIEPIPTDGMVFNSEKWEWDFPVPYPTDGKDYAWNGSNWVERASQPV